MPRIQHSTREEFPLIIDGKIPASEIGMTEPVYVGDMNEKTIYVKATKDTKIYPLIGRTAIDCIYKLKSGTGVDTEDADREWDCNNESIAFQITEHCSYISIVIVNEDVANEVTVNVGLS